MSENKLFKGKMPTPTMGVPANPDSWWSRPAWQPGAPRPFTSQHNFGQLSPQEKPEARKNFSTRKNFDGMSYGYPVTIEKGK